MSVAKDASNKNSLLSTPSAETGRHYSIKCPENHMRQSDVGSFLLIPWTQTALKFRSNSHQLPVANTYLKAIQSVLNTKKNHLATVWVLPSLNSSTVLVTSSEAIWYERKLQGQIQTLQSHTGLDTMEMNC